MTEDKLNRVIRLIREREKRKQRDLRRWCAAPSHGIVAAFLDEELLEGACAPSPRLRMAWVARRQQSLAR